MRQRFRARRLHARLHRGEHLRPGHRQRDPEEVILDNYLPVEGSVLLGAESTVSGDWFDSVDFIGAVGAEDWTAGWTVGL